MTPHPAIGYLKRQIIGDILDFRAYLLIIAIIVNETVDEDLGVIMY